MPCNRRDLAARASAGGRGLSGLAVHRMSSRDPREKVLRHRARSREGTGMYEPQASVEPRTEELAWGCTPPMFCAITGRQPWIDRISDRFFERSF